MNQQYSTFSGPPTILILKLCEPDVLVQHRWVRQNLNSVQNINCELDLGDVFSENCSAESFLYVLTLHFVSLRHHCVLGFWSGPNTSWLENMMVWSS